LFGVLFLLAFPPFFARRLVSVQLARAKSQEIIISSEAVERHVAGTAVRALISSVHPVDVRSGALLALEARASEA
jgi:hypothetical protein